MMRKLKEHSLLLIFPSHTAGKKIGVFCCQVQLLTISASSLLMRVSPKSYCQTPGLQLLSDSILQVGFISKLQR